MHLVSKKGDVIPQMEFQTLCMIRSKKRCILLQKGECYSTTGISSLMYDIHIGCYSPTGLTSPTMSRYKIIVDCYYNASYA